ncbi:hypothetical protein HK098_007128, partial [Nowakowskiella sp. JEL0407]
MVRAIEKLKIDSGKVPGGASDTSQPAASSNASSSSPATSTNSSPQNPTLAEYDVMLSYCWTNQLNVLRISDALKAKGFSVWIDVDYMTSSVYGSMHQAVSSSKVIIPCLSPGYVNSANCERELSYAADKKKRIVPIRLQNGSFDWADLITAGKLYFFIDFSNISSSEFEAKMDELEKEIRQPSATTPTASTTAVSAPPPVPAVPAVPTNPSFLSELKAWLKWSSPSVHATNPSILSELKAWLKPEEVEMDNDMEQHFRKQFPGTREWLYSEILDFANNDNEIVFWSKGVAGVGKSVVSAVTCKRLKRDGKLGGYFFCKHNNVNRNKPQRIIVTLCYHLAQQFPDFANAVNTLRQSKDEFLEKANVESYFAELIVEPLTIVSPDQRRNVVVVIDALDECGVISSPERKALIKLLSDWEQVPKFVKLLVTSRPESDIQSILSGVFKAHEIDLNDKTQQKDLLMFSTNRLRLLQHRMGVPMDQVEEYAGKLAEAANGLFIWLALAMEDICHEDSDSLTVLQQYLAEKSDPENNDHQMDGMYTSSLMRATQGKKAAFVNSLAEILSAIVVVRAPVSDDALAKLFGTTLSDIRAKLSSIGSLLNISDKSIQVIHKSFADFLQSPTRCTDPQFLIDIPATNLFLASRCLDSMNTSLYFNIGGYDVKDPGSKPTKDMTKDIPEHLVYSLKYWISHLMTSNLTNLPNDIESSLETFTFTHALHWIEVLSLTGGLPVAQVQLARFLPNIKNERITALLQDIPRFVNEFRTPIAESAIHVYYSALTMCPEDTALFKEYAGRYKDVIHRVVVGKDSNWSSCLATFEGHEGPVVGVDWWISEDKETSLIASASWDNTIRLWDAFTGVELHQFKGNSDEVNCVVFSKDGRFIVTGSRDKSIMLWDIET